MAGNSRNRKLTRVSERRKRLDPSLVAQTRISQLPSREADPRALPPLSNSSDPARIQAVTTELGLGRDIKHPTVELCCEARLQFGSVRTPY
jgi:hypothetical protein